MYKTREELEAEGTLLIGRIVPEWFKNQCDGCSVPKGFKWSMCARQLKAACVIHDDFYYTITIMFDERDPRFPMLRAIADYELRMNVKSIIPKGFKNLYSAIYFRGVRLGGKYCVKEIPELPVPPTQHDLEELFDYIEHRFGEPTQRAKDIYKTWTKKP